MSTSPNGGGPPPPPPPPPITTMVLPVPVSTVTVDTTLFRTTFVTITTNASQSSSTSCTAAESSGCRAILHPAHSRSESASLPPVVSRTPSEAPHHASTLGSTARNGEHSSLTEDQKHAIIGGLSSAIAGLVFIGILVALLLRRRQKRKGQTEVKGENGLRRSISRTWSQVTSSRTVPRPTPPLSRQSSTADVNGSVIRMSLGGFPRPYAHHKSWRESMGLGRLMVMNPDDASETNTAGQRGSVESAITLFQQQRNRSSVISAAFLRRSHSRASSNTPVQDYAPPVPVISINPALSSESLPQPATAPSFSSYPSSPSVRTIQQRPPEDPFLTPPDERLEEVALSPAPRIQRPSLAVLQNAAGSASRSLSHLGQALNPFRSKANTTTDDEEDGTASRQSTLTFSSNGDPFKLDRGSLIESSSVWPERSPRRAPPAHIAYDRMYEGT